MADKPLHSYDGNESTYSREDSALVIRLLRVQGSNVYWDEGIRPGAPAPANGPALINQGRDRTIFGVGFRMLLTLSFGFLVSANAEEPLQPDREVMYDRYFEFHAHFKGGTVEANWMADGSSFWYIEEVPGDPVIWQIDPRRNVRQKITQAPSSRLVTQGTPRVLPHPFINLTEEVSPDGRWISTIKDHNLWLRASPGNQTIQLTTDGVEGHAWGHDIWNEWMMWSPDSSKLASVKVDLRQYPRIPVVNYLGAREVVEWVHDYNPRADQRIPQTRLFILDVASKRQVEVKIGVETYFLSQTGWRRDGSELLFQRMHRDFQQLELVAADSMTGKTRVILTERSKTFVLGLGVPLDRLITWLPDGNRFIWLSERDGWKHLYLYNVDGTLIRRLTSGRFPVAEIIEIDEEANWVYFSAHGDAQRPYDTHLYRVNLQGKQFQRLTEAPGQHEIEFAPSREFFLDSHSSVGRPPQVDLRRADGSLLQVLTQANTKFLEELRWSAPEEFVVKADDGQTDLYGVLYKPFDFDPNKKYPVIDAIYGGPQSSNLPKSFAWRHYGELWGAHAALAQLGCIVFIVDGRGTPGRGKQFHDVAYANLGRHEIPDHVATLMQLADKRPYMDLSRVGIVGSSVGGYLVTRAMLMAPDVYHVGIATAQDSDMHIFGAYMGSPTKNKAAWEYASNVRLADQLKGKLLLIHGTSDSEAPISHTMKMVDAFSRANKPYDLLILPGQGHSLHRSERAAYWRAAHRRYLQEHLLRTRPQL